MTSRSAWCIWRATAGRTAARSRWMRTWLNFPQAARRFRRPQRYEPVFRQLSEAGLAIDGVNAPHKPTFTFNRAIPPVFRPKLDWIGVRSLAPVAGTAAVIPARPSFFSSRVSDHDFVTVEVDL